jgi:predicted nucleotidyltransferase
MFQDLLEKTALALDERSIPYMLIGGQAVLLYGEPRLTKDIDITLGVGPERLPDVVEMVEGLGWKVLVETPETFVRETMVLPCSEPLADIRVDFIFSSSPYEQQAMERVRHVPVGRAQVRFASIEDLIIHKLIAGRPRDVEDVKSVLVKNREVDIRYIRHWLEQFEDTLSEPFLKRFEEILVLSQ